MAFTPSTTMPPRSVISSRVAPRPMAIPALLFLLCRLVQVTIKSPIPDNPAKVKGLAFNFLPNLDISTIPLVMRAALVLSPKPKPSEIPTARAITFFNAPDISTPTMSRFVYTLNLGVINISCMYSAVCLSLADTTTAVGKSLDTSSAWLGPDNTATLQPGTVSSITWDNLKKVLSSKPLATFTII